MKEPGVTAFVEQSSQNFECGRLKVEPKAVAVCSVQTGEVFRQLGELEIFVDFAALVLTRARRFFHEQRT